MYLLQEQLIFLKTCQYTVVVITVILITAIIETLLIILTSLRPSDYTTGLISSLHSQCVCRTITTNTLSSSSGRPVLRGRIPRYLLPSTDGAEEGRAFPSPFLASLLRWAPLGPTRAPGRAEGRLGAGSAIPGRAGLGAGLGAGLCPNPPRGRGKAQPLIAARQLRAEPRRAVPGQAWARRRRAAPCPRCRPLRRSAGR